MSVDKVIAESIERMRGEIIKECVKEILGRNGDPIIRDAFMNEVKRLMREDDEVKVAIKSAVLRAMGTPR
jgi:hypothetical protein